MGVWVVTQFEALINSRVPVQQESEIDKWLRSAKLAMEAGRLVEPDSDNAAIYFQLALNKEPQNLVALQGLDSIVNFLVEQAQGKIEISDFEVNLVFELHRCFE